MKRQIKMWWGRGNVWQRGGREERIKRMDRECRAKDGRVKRRWEGGGEGNERVGWGECPQLGTGEITQPLWPDHVTLATELVQAARGETCKCVSPRCDCVQPSTRVSAPVTIKRGDVWFILRSWDQLWKQIYFPKESSCILNRGMSALLTPPAKRPRGQIETCINQRVKGFLTSTAWSEEKVDALSKESCR